MYKNWIKLEYAVHPGEILEEYLNDAKLSQIGLAEKIGINKTIINEIIKGKRPITMRTAIKLEKVFSFPAKFWSNLQMIYDEAKERLDIRNESLSSEATTELSEFSSQTENQVIKEKITNESQVVKCNSFSRDFAIVFLAA